MQHLPLTKYFANPTLCQFIKANNRQKEVQEKEDVLLKDAGFQSHVDVQSTTQNSRLVLGVWGNVF